MRAFDRVVWRGLGLDRHPELRDDYFRHYERVVWLAQAPTDELHAKAERRRGSRSASHSRFARPERLVSNVPSNA